MGFRVEVRNESKTARFAQRTLVTDRLAAVFSGQRDLERFWKSADSGQAVCFFCARIDRSTWGPNRCIPQRQITPPALLCNTLESLLTDRIQLAVKLPKNRYDHCQSFDYGDLRACKVSSPKN